MAMRKTPSIVVFAFASLTLSYASSARAAGPTLLQQGAFTGASDAFFGYAVAVDGDTAVVGAINDNANKGAAYVYVRQGTSWSLQQTLVAADGAQNDEFGYAVAISGGTILVDASGRANGQGYVYAFTQSGVIWAQQQEFTDAGGAAGDCFGCALALSGTTALVGADGASGNLGAAYVFTNAGTWTQQQEFLGQASTDYFGFSVALSPAGNVALVGAFGAANDAGDAYLFTSNGASWSQPQAPLVASDGQAGDRFGYAVAVTSGSALIGAYNSGGSGAAYVFTQSGATWSQQQKLVPADPTGADSFGSSVALDGSLALVGAYEHGGPLGPGAAYTYTIGSGALSFSQELFAPAANQYFANAVALSGTTAVIGAFGASNDSGAAYLDAPAPVVAAAAPALGGRSGVPVLMLLFAAAGCLATRSRRGEAQS
jgi:hypothetical protein